MTKQKRINFGKSLQRQEKKRKEAYLYVETSIEGKIQDMQNYIQSKDGDTLTESRAIMDGSKEHFQELLNGEIEGENRNEQQAADDKEQKEISIRGIAGSNK
ncbi:hypothetical protein Trydic_g16217 [Trypoxylus dichotomus]